MKMKLIGIAVIILLFAGIALGQADIKGHSFQVSLAKSDPVPATGGRPITIWFDVVNKGYDQSGEATFTIEPTYPFTTADGILSKTYERIGSGESVRIEFRLLVDRYVGNTTGIIRLKYSYGSTEAKKDFNITVAE